MNIEKLKDLVVGALLNFVLPILLVPFGLALFVWWCGAVFRLFGIVD